MARDQGQQPFSVLDQLGSHEWSTQESVAYEAAIEAINGAVGAYTARINAEQAEAQPDTQKIDDWRGQRRECEAVRRGLDPADHEQIARARQRYAALAEQLRQGGQAS